MIIILFRGRETIAPAGSGRRESLRGIRNPNLPSAAHPAWMGSRNLRRIISLLHYSGGMELADEVLLGHAPPQAVRKVRNSELDRPSALLWKG